MKKHKVAKAITVSLVEDDPGVRANLASLIDSTTGFKCQAAYPDGPSALKDIPGNRPDVVLMDINLPGMLGTECVRRLKIVAPDVPVLMLTVYDDSEQIFKSLMAWRYRKQFNQLGLPSIYRADGTEAVYSPEKILALGLREFEFDRDWPASLEFIGYPRGAPGFGAPVPPIQDDRPHILVSLGTHLLWAKDRALGLIVDLAERLPGVVFHFSRGLPGGTRQEMTGRVLVCDYIPYDQCLSGYRAVIFHGGSGLLQSCLFHGLPMLVWPHDYDQFDHAARIVHHGLGLKLKLSPQDAVQQIQFLLSDESTQWRLHHFRGISRKHAPLERVGELFLKRAAR